MFGLSDFRKSLVRKLRNKAYRDAYVGEHVRRWIATQIRTLRDDREWNQGELSRKLGKPQSVVSRLEDPSYGKMTVNTLLEVATAFDVALLIKFVDYPTFLRETRDLTPSAMTMASFDENAFAASIETEAPGNVIDIGTARMTVARINNDDRAGSPIAISA